MAEEREPVRLNRRVVVGAIGGTLVTAAVLNQALAQESTTDTSGTPEADTSTTEESTVTEDSAARLAERIVKVREDIAAVQADRDAVASEIDVAEVDELIALATTFVDAAETASTGESLESAMQFARAAGDVAAAAGNLISAQLSYAGLPSQEAQAVRHLSSAYEQVAALTEAAANGESAEASDLATRSQALYATAYELYDQVAFAQALGWGRAASNLSGAGLALLGEATGDGPGSGGGRNRGRDERPGNMDDTETSDGGTPTADTENSEPQTVPAPDF